MTATVRNGLNKTMQTGSVSAVVQEAAREVQPVLALGLLRGLPFRDMWESRKSASRVCRLEGRVTAFCFPILTGS